MRREKMFKKVAKRNYQERNTRRTGCLIYARSVRMIKGKKNEWEESLSIEVYLKRSRF